MMIRQGDILLHTTTIPPSAILKKRGEITLAFGEATGHRHILRNAQLLESPEQSYVKLETPSLLTHEEHATVEIPVGEYVVIRAREYTPEAPRQIAD